MTDPEPPPIYTPSNLPFGWTWFSYNGADVEFLHGGDLMGRVVSQQHINKWFAKTNLYMPHVVSEHLGTFDTKNEAIAAIVARHVQHKLEGNP